MKRGSAVGYVSRHSFLVIFFGVCVLGPSRAEQPDIITLNFQGVPGLIDMPSAQSLPDGELGVSVSHFSGITRNTLTFQITDRLSGSFRYSGTQDWPNSGFDTYYDRSFDLRYRVLDEGRILPDVTVGLQDFAGTGLNSAEYIVATKTIVPKLRFTTGVGWGRLATYGEFSSVFGSDDRSTDFEPTGGTINEGRWFRGPMAFFGGAEWDVAENITLQAEYSSDDYVEESSRDIVDRAAPFNFGIQYRPRDGLALGAYYMYGSEIGAQVSFIFNPKNSAYGTETAPLPVRVTERDLQASQSWGAAPELSTAQKDQLALSTVQLFKEQGLEMESLKIDGAIATVWFRNPTYDIEAQAIGRAARSLTYSMPEQVRRFVLVPTRLGVPLSKITIDRGDLARAEFDINGAARLKQQVKIEDAADTPLGGERVDDLYPRFNYSIGPYVSTLLFGLENPVQADVGVRVAGRYDVAPGLSFNGSIRKRLIGNLSEGVDVSESELEPVRTERPRYDREGDPALERLTVDYHFRPGTNLYGRVSTGYLERMYAGVSTEMLWKPVDSRLALGAELNYARKRDYDQDLQLLDFDAYTGFLSAYYDFNNGFQAQVDIGQYLAGDQGGTFTLAREFDNGWRVAAFATFTDVSYEEFGDGSFDKGITLTVPISTVTSKPSRETANLVIRPFQRDGGARLQVEDRLYPIVRDYHEPQLNDTWERVQR
ncbi:YjbH domain-containing protein [Parasulfitobacter algicola]|uniref:YjbH domain-containing protein n=1 Tax=Parasulfitobacter algicola TaxID=2614809 RepID=A0ABX2IK37_9RHOB|nr:YjbH domain-containing protein [Sulfitobacter algicola]NSX53239.1 YjbH domain-containing protein [Sulfitobacter algicola]